MKRKQNLCFIITVALCGIIMIVLCQPGFSARIRELQQTALLRAAEERSYAAAPEDPTSPANPEDPTAPANPEDPTAPANPEDPSHPANPEDITLEIFDGDSMDVYVSAGKKTFFRFVAPRSGNFVLYSTGDDDTCGYLYASDARTELAWDDDYYDCNFRLEYDFTGGESYFFAVEFYGGWNSGTISVTLEHEHVWESRVITEATCSAPGEMEDVCLICGRTERYSYYVDHAWDEGEVLQEASCTLQRIVKFTCTVCGEAFYEFGDALGHRWSECELVCAESCEEEGQVRLTCAICGETLTQSIPKKMHTDADGDGVCEACSGTYIIVSSGQCGDNAFWTLDAYGRLVITGEGMIWDSVDHTPFLGLTASEVRSVVIEPGITGIGYWAFGWFSSMTEIVLPSTITTVSLSGCTSLREITIPETATYIYIEDCAIERIHFTGTLEQWHRIHYYDYQYDISPNVDCNAVSPYHFHTPDGGVVTKEPSCAEYGTVLYTCTVCGEAFYEYDNALGHSWDDGVVTKEPSCTEYGTVLYTCTVCGNTDEEALPPRHTDKNADGVCDLCGAEVYAVTDTGKCGPSLTYTLYENGLLEIRGTGEMYDYNPNPGEGGPWGDSVYSVEFCAGIKSIGSSAFYGCCELKNVVIPEGVMRIGSSAFSGCSSLHSVSLPDTLKQIDSWAFYGCGNLLSVTFPIGLLHIESYAFYGSGLNDVYFGVTREHWMAEGYAGDYALWYAEQHFAHPVSSGVCGDSLTWTLCDNGLLIIDGEGTMYGYEPGEAPWGDRVSYAMIPSDIDAIAEYVLSDCNDLTDVYLDMTREQWLAKDIPDCVFPDSAELHFVECIGSGVCGNHLTWTEYSNGHLVIEGTGPMYDYDPMAGPSTPWDAYVRSVEIRPGASYIGNNAFFDIDSLVSVSLPDSVSAFGLQLFHGCRNLTSVRIPEGVACLPHGVFWDCCSLTEILIPDSVTDFGDYAFCDCIGLTSLRIPAGIDHIGYMALSGCSGLESITVAEGNEVYNSVENCVINKAEKTLVAGCKNSVIPADGSVTRIGENAFNDQTELTGIVIPHGVTDIEDNAFYGCSSLCSVEIPVTVTNIGYAAFFACNDLTDVYYAGTEEAWENVNIASGNDSLWNAEIHFGTEPGPGQCDHVWDEGIVIEVATCTKTGSIEYTCILCGAKKYSVIYQDHVDEDEDYICDLCGKRLYDFKLGEHVYAKLEDTVLTIFGYGPIDDSWKNIEMGESPLWSYYYSVIRIGRDITYIPNGEFMRNTEYTEITVEEGNPVYHSENNCLIETASCTLLIGCKNSVIPADGSVKYISGDAFYGSEIQTVDIPQGVERIENYAFSYCNMLSSVTISASVTEIGNNAFCSCSNLETVTVAEGNPVYHSQNNCLIETASGTLLLYCNNAVIPADGSVTRIGAGAFDPVAGTDVDITLPAAVESIASGAFSGYYVNITLRVLNRDAEIEENAIPARAVIYGYEGSTAEAYALSHGNTFIVIHEHIWDEGEVTVSPTCEENGTKLYTCTECGETYTEELPALGHDYVDHEGQAATCLVEGWKPYQTCSRCDYTSYEKIDALGHDYVEHTAKAATCTEIGWDAYQTCSRCNYTTYKEIAALGHDYVEHEGQAATCLADGWKPYQTCSRCDYTSYEKIDALGHDYGEWTQTTNPTCTEAGVETRYCSRCDATETRPVEERGHDYIGVVTEPTCTEDGYTTYTCSRCGDSYTADETDALGHDYVNHDGQSATCLEDGWKPYQTCTRCDYTSYEKIDALGHDYVDHGGQTATCTEIGWKAYQTCTRCDFTNYEKIDALGHDYVNHEGQAATCLTDGWKSYQTCTRCDYTSYEKIDALGHDYVNHDEQSATCLEDGWKPYQTCSRCDYTSYEKIDALGHDYANHDGQSATCLEDGWKPYQTCTRCDYTNYEKIDALGHDYAGHEGQAATCLADGWKPYQTCTRCDYTSYEKIDALGHDYVDHDGQTATCTEIGWDTYQTCSRCDYTTYKEIAALGHNYVNHDGQAATCIAEGWKPYQTCTRCDYTSYEKIAVLGHDYVDHDAKAATCTEIGWKAYKTCSRCNYTTYEEIPALGHDYGEWTQTQAPSCTEKGEEKRTCSRCDAAETRTVDALTHRFTVLRSDAASHWYECANGCGICTEKEPHSFGAWITDVEATAEREGTAHRICADCQYTETKTLPKEIETYLFGDVDHDGLITAADARSALRKAVGLELYEAGSYEFFMCDVDFDGTVTAADARLILRAAVNLEDPNTWLEKYRAMAGETMRELSLSVGDADRSAGIEPADAPLALRISLGLLQDGTQTMDEVNKLAADVDVDGEVNPGDARLILRKSLGLDVASEGWNDV